MPDVAICLRYGRAVVSHRIAAPAGLGWHPASNWHALELLAWEEVRAAKEAGHPGPFVYPCSAALAAEAIWLLPGQPRQQALFPESEMNP